MKLTRQSAQHRAERYPAANFPGLSRLYHTLADWNSFLSSELIGFKEAGHKEDADKIYEVSKRIDHALDLLSTVENLNFTPYDVNAADDLNAAVYAAMREMSISQGQPLPWRVEVEHNSISIWITNDPDVHHQFNDERRIARIISKYLRYKGYEPEVRLNSVPLDPQDPMVEREPRTIFVKV